MTYDWEPFKEICYRMYVEEKKTLREVHAFLSENHNFKPRYVVELGHLAPRNDTSTSGNLHATSFWLPVQPLRQIYILYMTITAHVMSC